MSLCKKVAFVILIIVVLTFPVYGASSCDEAISWLSEAKYLHQIQKPTNDWDTKWIDRYTGIIFLLERLCNPIGE